MGIKNKNQKLLSNVFFKVTEGSKQINFLPHSVPKGLLGLVQGNFCYC
jgi:hypothetical protein